MIEQDGNNKNMWITLFYIICFSFLANNRSFFEINLRKKTKSSNKRAKGDQNKSLKRPKSFKRPS